MSSSSNVLSVFLLAFFAVACQAQIKFPRQAAANYASTGGCGTCGYGSSSGQYATGTQGGYGTAYNQNAYGQQSQSQYGYQQQQQQYPSSGQYQAYGYGNVGQTSQGSAYAGQQQYDSQSQATGSYGSSSSTSSSQQPGYLPNYYGDQYTNPQAIQETQAMNAAFFQSIGGEPVYPGGVQSTSTQTSTYGRK